MRRTKIIATMGPATNTPEAVEAMIHAGVDVVRLNFSHGELEDHKYRAKLVRDAADNWAGRLVFLVIYKALKFELIALLAEK